MAKKQVKLWVVQETKEEGKDKDIKVLLSLKNASSDTLKEKVIATLTSVLEEQDVLVEKESISKIELVKKLLECKEDLKVKAEAPEEQLGQAIMTLAKSFTENETESLEKSSAIYVAYLMMKDDISLDKIMKYANLSKQELEVVKYYLLDKNNF